MFNGALVKWLEKRVARLESSVYDHDFVFKPGVRVGLEGQVKTLTEQVNKLQALLNEVVDHVYNDEARSAEVKALINEILKRGC